MSVNIFSESEADRLILHVEGRIDSSNAAEVEKTVFSECEKKPDAAIVLDAEKLEYISSAGLRILLKLKKEKTNVVVNNVSLDVYEIFEMTGFTEIMEIHKRMRRVSIEGCKLIGQGGMGKVYRYDPETIIKVYRPEVQMEYIERERNCSQTAFKQGIPTAISFDVVRVGDSYGVMYELMDADNLASLILNHPEKEEEYIKKYADLGREIHSIELQPGTLQPVSEMFFSSMNSMERWLTGEELALYTSLIDVIPTRNTVIHGDFHEKNILVRDDDLEMIDMGDISQGHPLVELGCVYSSHIELAKPVLGMTPEKGREVWEKFLHHYFDDLDSEKEALLLPVLRWISAMRRLPFYCDMMDPSVERFIPVINQVKKEAFVDAEEMKKQIEAVDQLLFRK